MPIKLSSESPVADILESKGVDVIDPERADEQDIRPLVMGLLNLMPTKLQTEAQILRALGSGPIQIEPILMTTASHQAQHDKAHVDQFYTTFDEMTKTRKALDGLIITGAPVAEKPFDEVDYWEELTRIMDWARTHVTSTLFLCWGALAALNYHYGIPKHRLPRKMFGVFEHTHTIPGHFLLNGMDDRFHVPHSRHTEVRREDIENEPELEVVSEAEGVGLYLIAHRDIRKYQGQFLKRKEIPRDANLDVCIIGHPEYDRNTAKDEDDDQKFRRDVPMPQNYFPNNDRTKTPILSWRANGVQLYQNWVNMVYLATPFRLENGLNNS